MEIQGMMTDFDVVKKVIDSVKTEAQLETAQKYYEAFCRKWSLPTKYSIQNSLQSRLIYMEHKLVYSNEQNY